MSDPKRGLKLAKLCREVLEVDADLEKISDLEQALRNADTERLMVIRRTQKASEELSGVEMKLAEGQDDLKLAKKEAEDTISLAKQTAQEIVVEAEEVAKGVIKRSLEQERMVADRIVVDQERHAHDMSEFADAETEARVAVAAIEEKLADLRAQIGM